MCILFVVMFAVLASSGCSAHGEFKLGTDTHKEQVERSAPTPIFTPLSDDGWTTDIKAASFKGKIPLTEIDSIVLPDLWMSLQNGGSVGVNKLKIEKTRNEDAFGNTLYVLWSNDYKGQFSLSLERINSRTGIINKAIGLGEFKGQCEVAEGDIKPSYGEDVILVVSGTY